MGPVHLRSPGPGVQVLIAGAGPTGLVLALWLTRLGIKVRIVDQAAEPGTTSRALAVQARTLEFYRQIGLADAAVQRGVTFENVNLWLGGHRAAQAPLGRLGANLSPFPYALIFPQDEHERLLIERLGELGVKVERPVELAGFTDEGGVVRARLKRPDGGEETCEAAYLAGCDGAHSQVRRTLGVGFPGGTYEHLFYVADVEADGPVMNGELNAAVDEADLLLVFPMKGGGRARLIGTVRPEAAAGDKALTFADVSPRIVEQLRLDVKRVNWFSTYRVHHRVTDSFRRGRVFLLGDAAHIHSPVGGQGMNTGIGDAVNLSWKLAQVLRGRADDRLLATYEPERRAFARRLVATTDRAFTLVTHPGWLARRMRVSVVPRLMPFLLSFETVRRFMFRTVSQTAIRYRSSFLSEGRAGKVRAGDRLPWVRMGPGEDNFTPLAALAWQVHIYGTVQPDLRGTCAVRSLAVHAFAWRPEFGQAGLRQDALYLIRPDGYVALADPAAHPRELLHYLDSRGLQPAFAERQDPADRARTP